MTWVQISALWLVLLAGVEFSNLPYWRLNISQGLFSAQSVHLRTDESKVFISTCGKSNLNIFMTHLISFRKRECRESNPGPLGEKRKCYYCAMPATLEVKDLILFGNFLCVLTLRGGQKKNFPHPPPHSLEWRKKREKREKILFVHHKKWNQKK